MGIRTRLRQGWIGGVLALQVVCGHSAEDLAGLVRPLLRTVVSVSSTTKVKVQAFLKEQDLFFDFFGQEFEFPHRKDQKKERTTLGSGFFLDAQGHVVTNYHVIKEAHRKKGKISVTVHEGEEFEAKVVGYDEGTDVALLKVSDAQKFHHIQWADVRQVQIGHKVIAIGNPFGLGGTVTAGIVSNLSRDIGTRIGLFHVPTVVQTDASINSGNSGAPIFDMNGRVIAMATFIVSPTGGNVGLNFAIPADIVQKVVEQLKNHGYVKRAWLGIGFDAVDKDMAESVGLKEPCGVFVHSVTKKSPAERAGIQKGDVLLSLQGQSLKHPLRLPYLVGALPIGKPIDVVLWRYNTDKKTYTKKTVRITAEECEKSKKKEEKPKKHKHIGQSKDIFGLTLRQSVEQGRSVVVITDIQGINKKLYERGVRPGQILLSVDNQKVCSAEDVARLTRQAQKAGKKSVLLWISQVKKSRNARTQSVFTKTFAVPLVLQE